MVEILGYVIAGLLTIANSVILYSLNRKNKLQEDSLFVKQQEAEDRQLLHEGIQLILYFNIKNEALKLLQHDVVEYHEYEFLSKMHVIYHKFGGNGDLDHLMEGVFNKVLSNK